MGLLLWLVIGGLAGVGIYLFAGNWHFLTKQRRTATGVVFDYKRERDDDSEFFKPKVRFKAHNGREYEFIDYVGFPKPGMAIGTKVTVAYPDGYPERARIHRYWVRPVLYAFIGFALVVLMAKRFGYLS